MTSASAMPDRSRNVIVVLTVLTTVVATLVAGLQVDASIRADRANRESQLQAIRLMGMLQRTGLSSAHELAGLARITSDRIEALALELAGVRLQGMGDAAGAASASLRAQAAEARALAQEGASILYQDPRYRPTTTGGVPNLEAYVGDLNAETEALRQEQNAAADDFEMWNRKADAYVGVLTLLATALFLLGLGQALVGRLRVFFAIAGVCATNAALLWASSILVLVGAG
jgi:hypothetical protein